MTEDDNFKIGMTEDSCVTCDYKFRYAKLMAMMEYNSHTPEDSPLREKLDEVISAEIASLLQLGFEIAEARCEGNMRAAMAIFS